MQELTTRLFQPANDNAAGAGSVSDFKSFHSQFTRAASQAHTVAADQTFHQLGIWRAWQLNATPFAMASNPLTSVSSAVTPAVKLGGMFSAASTLLSTEFENNAFRSPPPCNPGHSA